MRYGKVIPAVFLERPNRFIAHVDLDGAVETVHVKNTGRCKELLLPGTKVYLAEGSGAKRKTRYDLIAVEKQRDGKVSLLVNMDSQVVNDVAAEWLPVSGLVSPNVMIRREVTMGDSRFDLYAEDGDRRLFMEVKGVTLEWGGIAAFPDAPTERGVKHIRGLMACAAEGYETYILFVLQMKGIRLFRPHWERDPKFAQALREASAAGVRVLVRDCAVTPDEIVMGNPVPFVLG